MIYIRKRLYK